MLRPRPDAEAHRYAQALRALGIRMHRPHATALEHLASQIDHGVLFEFFHTAERLLPSLRLLWPDLPMAVSCADLHSVREARAAMYVERPRVARAKVRRTRRRELGVDRRADLVVAVTEADRWILTRAVPDAATAVVNRATCRSGSIGCRRTCADTSVGYALHCFPKRPMRPTALDPRS